ncbi:hypothetical protein QBC47DRAFT_388998 [Echria macrotheca]|uniref:Lipid droplet-associated hydrolase n=1 Tax=Echria macrotheca TaxID=438768 RepID=A0AAJ0B6J9_9PEZI|nr:hypothetical protein QBC47DRAFT_388998 [Echria macrotheca]
MLYENVFSHPEDVLLYQVGQPGSVGERFVVYILPGNPGLIRFYLPFVETLAIALKASRVANQVSVRICGRSLIGFETDPAANAEGRFYGMEETLIRAEEDVAAFAGLNKSSDRPRDRTKVILMGHSVGGYLLMEMLRRAREGRGRGEVDIVGGILLFPTITDIAKSRIGRVISPILAIPNIAKATNALTSFFFSFWSLTATFYLMMLLLWYPPAGAYTVALFVRSRLGVGQALHLGREEMVSITHDKWDESVWGTGKPGDPTLYMYFGQNDGHVPNSARDELIRTRGTVSASDGTQQRRAFIDSDKIPHNWCISHEQKMVTKVVPWLEDIITQHSEKPLER